jgi:hypothetical protein
LDDSTGKFVLNIDRMAPQNIYYFKVKYFQRVPVFGGSIHVLKYDLKLRVIIVSCDNPSLLIRTDHAVYRTVRDSEMINFEFHF